MSWDGEEPVSLGDGFGEIYARAVSGDGAVVASGAIDPDKAAIRWTLETGWKALPIGDEIYATAESISHDGNVIVGSVDEERALGRHVESGAARPPWSRHERERRWQRGRRAIGHGGDDLDRGVKERGS